MNNQSFVTTQNIGQDVSEVETMTLSLEDLAQVDGGGFINNWKQGIAFAVSPTIYTGGYVYGRWIDR
jgi:hypothetical protein